MTEDDSASELLVARHLTAPVGREEMGSERVGVHHCQSLSFVDAMADFGFVWVKRATGRIGAEQAAEMVVDEQTGHRITESGH